MPPMRWPGKGRKHITVYWHALKSDGQVNPKYPGSIEAIREKLEAEGHTVILNATDSSLRIPREKPSTQNSSSLPCPWLSGLKGGVPVRLQRRITLPAALAWLGWLALGQTAEPVDLARAEALARQYCITCHFFPSPTADKKTWPAR